MLVDDLAVWQDLLKFHDTRASDFSVEKIQPSERGQSYKMLQPGISDLGSVEPQGLKSRQPLIRSSPTSVT